MSTDLRCTVDGCGRPQHARGWCKQHYRRWMKHGTPDTTPIRRYQWLGRARCAAEGCVLPARACGYCMLHYQRWRRHGTPDGGATAAPRIADPAAVLRLARTQALSQRMIARQLGISRSAVWGILSGRRHPELHGAQP